MQKLTKGDTIPGIVSIILGAFAIIYNLLKPNMVIYGESRNGVLGAGFFPFVAGILLIVFGLFIVIRGIRQNGSVDYFELTPEKKSNLKRVGLVVLTCALFLSAWKLTRNYFLVCLFIYAIIINILLKRSKLFTILFAIIITAFVYGLFYMGFSIRFHP